MQPIFRNHEPLETPADYRKFKKYLRLDFERRCAYCHIPETRYGPSRNFTVDHFRPKSLYPQLIRTYRNLYYACACCNSFKGPVDGPFLDPCLEQYPHHFMVIADTGQAEPRTARGSYFIEHLNLNRAYLAEWRMGKAEMRRQLLELDSLLQHLESEISGTRTASPPDCRN